MAKLILFLTVLLMEIPAFIGLRGAIKKEFRFPKGKAGGMKRYKGKKAVKWGLIFFLTLSIIPILAIWISLEESTNLFLDIFLYAIVILISFVLSGLELIGIY